MSVADFEKIVSETLMTYLKASRRIGHEVAEHSNYVQSAFKTQLDFLKHANKAKMPTEDQQEQLFLPTYQHLLSALNYQQANQDSPYSEHLLAISETIFALQWVTVVRIYKLNLR